MRRYRAGSGAPWEARFGYSRVVRVGPHVVVTGTTATLPDGGHVDGDAAAQTRQIVLNLARALERVGARLDDVVRTRIFVTDIAADAEAVGRAHAEAFGAARPATTMVEVGLIAPWMRVEIEADAFLGAGPPLDAPLTHVVAARDGDRAVVAALAATEDLLAPGPEVELLVALDPYGTVVAAAGLERHGERGILRTVVTRADHRGRGVATLLVDALVTRHTERELWLVTRDRAGFFARLGFEEVARDTVPAALAATETFAHGACAGATAMRRPARSI
ncbi:MAG: GNAT family N-acetyltransferase [Sandaracinaceae bacterium]|nr:GNAT family N-acetyltransferase [Sandaracinaceae bacterium]